MRGDTHEGRGSLVGSMSNEGAIGLSLGYKYPSCLRFSISSSPTTSAALRHSRKTRRLSNVRCWEVGTTDIGWREWERERTVMHSHEPPWASRRWASKVERVRVTHSRAKVKVTSQGSCSDCPNSPTVKVKETDKLGSRHDEYIYGWWSDFCLIFSRAHPSQHLRTAIRLHHL
jgi:hypothetical protein